MSRLRSWLSGLPRVQYVPLFETGERLALRSHERGSGRTLLRRAPEMERAVIDLVATSLTRADWRGLLYVMAWGPREHLRPLYIGKAGRYGKTPGQLSANLAKLATDKSKFARWGDGNAYHIGDLSQAIFGWSAYKEAGQKYERWAEVLLAARTPPRLREPTHLLLVPWHEGQTGVEGLSCSLEEAETQAIDVAIEEFEDVVLNVQGEMWWAPAARVSGRVPPGSGPRRPYTVVDTAEALVRVAAELARETLIGLDVETTLYTQELRLVQISTRDRTYIVDPLAVRSLEPLRTILSANGPTKVIHNAAFERRILAEAGYEVANTFDSLRVSRQMGPALSSHRLAAVCERHIGRTLDKSSQASDWSVRPLSKAQLDYAAIDAEVLLDLHDVLVKHVERERNLF